MSTRRKESNLTEEDTTVEKKQSKPTGEPSDPSSSSSESSSSEGDDDPAYVPLAQSFPSSESETSSSSSSSSSSSEEETDNRKRPQELAAAGNGLFLRGYETLKSKARKRRRFGSLQQPDEPAHVRRQKREYYDSDNSYEALQAPGYDTFKADTVDYYELAARPSCSEPIFTQFHHDEVSKLIGYATDPKAQASSISAAAIHASLPVLLNEHSEGSSIPNVAGQSLQVPQSASIEDTSNAVNPLLGLPSVPLPTSHLRYISKVASQGSNFKERLEKRFNDSALVAAGMLVEEMITASLMPLAGYHVMRCRALEARRDEVAEENDSTKVHQPIARQTLIHPVTGTVMQSDKLLVDPLEKPSGAWTLPPDEAMMKLLEQDAIPPEGLYLTPPATRTLDGQKRKASEKEQHAMKLWSKDNKVDLKKIRDNMDIYRLFLRMENYKDTVLNPEPTKKRKGRTPRRQSLAVLNPDSPTTIERKGRPTRRQNLAVLNPEPPATNQRKGQPTGRQNVRLDFDSDDLHLDSDPDLESSSDESD